MQHWTMKRQISFVIHVCIVAIPFAFSTSSALTLWHDLFHDWNIAYAMVGVVDILSLIGLVMYIARIPSPFQALRHALPFLAIVPLGLHLHSLLGNVNPWLAWSVTSVSTAILVGVAWQCFTTIEHLFIPPIEAERERIREKVGVLAMEEARYQVVNQAIETFRSGADTPETTVVTTVSASVSTVKQLMKQHGVSRSTAWRMMKRDAVTMEEE